jgi:hypothetical protein
MCNVRNIKIDIHIYKLAKMNCLTYISTVFFYLFYGFTQITMNETIYNALQKTFIYHEIIKVIN